MVDWWGGKSLLAPLNVFFCVVLILYLFFLVEFSYMWLFIVVYLPNSCLAMCLNLQLCLIRLLIVTVWSTTICDSPETYNVSLL